MTSTAPRTVVRRLRAAACAAGLMLAGCDSARETPARRVSPLPSPVAVPADPWPSRPRPTPCPDQPSHCLAAQVRLPPGALSPRQAERAVGARAREVLAALASEDLPRLAALAHPERGVRFSPEPYVDVTHHVRLTRAEIAALAGVDAPRVWGYSDGSGRPIQATFHDLLRRRFHDRDYAHAPNVAFNRVIHAGNTLINVFEVYPRAVLAEYHFCVEDPQRTLDWQSLRLLFEPSAGEYFLVAVVHDHWTI